MGAHRDTLMFHCSEGMVSMREMTYRDQSTAWLYSFGTSIYVVPWRSFLPTLPIKCLQKPTQPQARLEIILHLLPVLHYRLTTVAADEAICISHILGLDP